MPVKWLDRRIAAPGPYLALCLREEDFKEVLRKLKSDPNLSWLQHERSHATTHTFRGTGGSTCVVCVNDWQGRSGIEVAGLLVHEAVHVWQEHCRDIGEHDPAIEQEAYAIQNIAQALMADFARQTCRP
jgi:hypothetical protein